MTANKAEWLTLPSDSASPTRVLVPASTGFGVENSSHLVQQAIRDHVGRGSAESSSYEGDETFVVGDLGAILRTHHRWQKNFPDIKPFYGKCEASGMDRTLLELIRSVAVKCNPNPMLLRMLAALQMGFDCASLRELRAVLALDVDPSNIVFSHPCKSISSLRFARDGGVFKTVFDNLEELEKISGIMPQAELILRIHASDKTANSSFGDKFGAIQQTTMSLLKYARELGLSVVGVSFHVGTGARDPMAFEKALWHAKEVFQEAETIGFKLSVLDIGGGFQTSVFEEIASAVRHFIAREFPNDVKVIAEPGRFYARPVYTVAAKVISRRQGLHSSLPNALYQSDGVYGSFMNVLLEEEIVQPRLIAMANPVQDLKQSTHIAKHKYIIWGPTCCGMDCVVREATFDREVHIGDWLAYENMGGYTSSTSTEFNGFSNQHEVIYISTERNAHHLLAGWLSLHPPQSVYEMNQKRHSGMEGTKIVPVGQSSGRDLHARSSSRTGLTRADTEGVATATVAAS